MLAKIPGPDGKLVPRTRGVRPVSAGLARRLDGWIPWLRGHRALLSVVPFAVLYMNQPLKWDYLYAALCLMGAVYFIFRA